MYFFAILACNPQKMVYSMCVDRTRVSHHNHKEMMTMKMSEILDAIASLARSQGFYDRLLRDLMRINENDPVRYDKIKSKLEEQKFGSVVDMVLFFEC